MVSTSRRDRSSRIPSTCRASANKAYIQFSRDEVQSPPLNLPLPLVSSSLSLHQLLHLNPLLNEPFPFPPPPIHLPSQSLESERRLNPSHEGVVVFGDEEGREEGEDRFEGGFFGVEVVWRESGRRAERKLAECEERKRREGMKEGLGRGWGRRKRKARGERDATTGTNL